MKENLLQITEVSHTNFTTRNYLPNYLLSKCLVLSRLIYCLPEWGPLLTVSNINWLKSLQHRAIRLCLGLQKYDHISQHYHTLQWLPLGNEIQYRSLCAMHHQYFQPQHIPLVPPIQFGHQHKYATKTTQFFAQPPRCQLSFTQRFFCYKVIHWWNAVPIDILLRPPSRTVYFYLCVNFCNWFVCVKISVAYVCCHFCMFARMLYMCSLPGKNGIADWLIKIKYSEAW